MKKLFRLGEESIKEGSKCATCHGRFYQEYDAINTNKPSLKSSQV